MQSFYAVGHELHLALFEIQPAPPVAGGGTTTPPEPPAPVIPVNFILRPLSGGTGTAVTWRSLDEATSGEVVRGILPIALNQAWQFIPLYLDEIANHFVFISGIPSCAAANDFTATTLENDSPDALAFGVLQTHFAAMQQTVINNHQNWINNPVPPPTPTGGAGFYRLERTFPDTDGDGMSDAFEFSNGSNPDSADEDGNGKADGDDDADGDGLSNEDEEILGTDPNLADTSGDGIQDGYSHEWFILNRGYSIDFEKEEPEAGEPDESGGDFRHWSSWDDDLFGEGALEDPPAFSSLGAELALKVPFDNQFVGGPNEIFGDTDDPLGIFGYSGSVTEDEDSGDQSYSATVKHARIVVNTARPVPLKTSYPALLVDYSGEGNPITGTSIIVEKDASSGFLDFTPTFSGDSPESEAFSRTLIPVETRLKTHQTGYDGYPRLFDEHYETRPWLMVPAEGDRSNSLVIWARNSNRLPSVNAGLTTSNASSVTPSSSGNQSSVDVTITGPAPSGTATLDIAGEPIANLAFYPKRTIKLTVHVVTLINDDEDLLNVKPNEGLPNQDCIRSAPGSTGLWSNKAKDDDYSNGFTPAIHTGPNGICESIVAGNPNDPAEQDIPLIPLGEGKPSVVFITGGPNGKINTPHDSLDGLTADGNGLHTGEDGIRQAKAIKQRISPINVPTRQELENELNRVFGLQANVFFTVTLNEVDVAYDVGHTDPDYPGYKHWGIDGEFDIFDHPGEETAEEGELKNAAFDATAHVNLYFLPTRIEQHTLWEGHVIPFAKPEGIADSDVPDRPRAYVRASTSFFTTERLILTAAHEIGHLKLPGNFRGLDHPYQYQNPLVPSKYLVPDPVGFPLLKKSDDRRRLMWNSASLGLPEPGTSKAGTLLIKPEWDILHNIDQGP